MNLYAIDPGTEQSALVRVEHGVISGYIFPNENLLNEELPMLGAGHLVIEAIESYGMAVGREVFATVFWSGRFAQAWDRRHDCTWSMLPRRDVKLTLCGSPKAKDANIRAALLDRYGGVSSAKKGGRLYGIRSHLWAALAVAETYKQLQAEKTARTA